MKAAIRRPRPSHNKMDMFVTVLVDQYSFPSGHATRMGFLAQFFYCQFHFHEVILFLFIAWTINVSLSRILLGRHFVSDVLCGYAIGVLEYYILLALWLSEEQCQKIVSFIEEDFHL